MTMDYKLLAAAVVLIAVSLPACGQSVSERARNDQVVMVESDDPAMNRAFEKARASLDEFFELARSPREGTDGYAIKVALKDGEYTEYFWVSDFEADGDSLTGVLGNEPEMVKTVKLGERFKFSRAQVVDWMYVEPAARRMHGNFTACALLTHEAPADAEEFKRQYGLMCD